MHTWKKLFICFLGAAVLITSLEFISSYGSFHPSGFNRLFPPHTLNEPRIIHLPDQHHYIAGFTSRYIYLGSYIFPFHILRLDFSLQDNLLIEIPIPTQNHLHGPTIKVQVDSPDIFLVDEINTAILTCPLSNTDSIHYLTTKAQISALECRALSTSRFIIRNVDSLLKSAVLSKLSLNHYPSLESRDLLQKQVDGIFCTDGMLHYDPSLQQLIYVYFYRNQYIGMDTNLQVMYRGKTLDSNSMVKISVSNIRSENETTLSAPPFSVNKLSAADGNYLFIQSALLANNENENEFKENSVIDVYDLKNQLYQFSFYLPFTAKQKMQDFKVSHGRLITLHGPYLEVFLINPAYLNQE